MARCAASTRAKARASVGVVVVVRLVGGGQRSSLTYDVSQQPIERVNEWGRGNTDLRRRGRRVLVGPRCTVKSEPHGHHM